eukprot:GFUD01002012.1.p1 GENE.GFUD01002012.1~~GFUD01002012.1.p1  ORF type:complete len:1027 (+),score=286.47 GFUD01002012.1:361-3441(+)
MEPNNQSTGMNHSVVMSPPMPGCPLTWSPSATCQDTISPLERLVRTKPIWYLVNTTREESANILHNKNPGNFLIRGSKQGDSQVLSVKLGSSHGFVVQHFIILTGEGGVWLEDSDLQFDNIVSLAFHYSAVCDELPQMLRLPDILETADSLQYLISLALLEKAFWSYPMAKPGRRSLLLTENKPPPSDFHSASFHSSSLVLSTHSSQMIQSELGEEQKSYGARDSQSFSQERQEIISQDHSSVITTPPRPPRRSSSRLSTPSPPMISSPPSTQRKNNSSGEERSAMAQRHSMARINMKEDYNKIISCHSAKQLSGQVWVSSPVFSPGQGLERRGRKESVFNDNYSKNAEPCGEDKQTNIQDDENTNEKIISVQNHNIEKASDYEDIWVQKKLSGEEKNNIRNTIEEDDAIISNNLHNNQTDEDPDYTEPLDRVGKKTVTNYYSSPKEDQTKGNWKSDENVYKTKLLSFPKHRFSDSNIRYEHGKDTPENTNTKDGSKGNIKVKQRKLSLDILLRKLSSKTNKSSAQCERNSSKQERRLSSMIGNIISTNIISRRVIGGSYQVDSSSWEFLNKDVEDIPAIRELDNIVENKDTEDDTIASVQRSSSKDSVYQSEFDSTSTMESHFTSQPGSDQEDSLLSLPPSTAYTDQVTLPTILTSCHTSNTAIQACIREMAAGKNTFFGDIVRQFIRCTKDCVVREPLTVMRNMRQFMTGMKNYLVRTGEENLNQIIEVERAKLSPNQFLNIDSAIEEVMHQVVIKPLREKLELFFCEKYESSGCNKTIIENIEYASEKTPSSFNIPEVPVAKLMNLIEQCKEYYARLEESFSPTEKLKHYLHIVRQIITHLSPTCSNLDAATFSSSLLFVLVSIGAENVEREAEMMWSLLDPNLLDGEAGYYLTLLFSTVHLLKNFKELYGKGNVFENVDTTKTTTVHPSLASMLPVLFPNESTGSLVQQTVPLRPGMTVRDVRRIIGSKMSARDTEEFCMYSLVAGKETKLEDSFLLKDVQDQDKPVFIYRSEACSILLPIL